MAEYIPVADPMLNKFIEAETQRQRFQVNIFKFYIYTFQCIFIIHSRFQIKVF